MTRRAVRSYVGWGVALALYASGCAVAATDDPTTGAWTTVESAEATTPLGAVLLDIFEVRRDTVAAEDPPVKSRPTEPAPAPSGSETDTEPCLFSTVGISDVTCGTVEMAGRGTDPAYRVDIAYAYFRATGSSDVVQDDPLVYLHGGPGGSIVSEAGYWYDTLVRPFVGERDVILWDQRGAGLSTNLPLCHSGDFLLNELVLDPDDAGLEADLNDEFRECAEAARDDGHDLSAYTGAASAGDLSDLMTALGIDRFNILASSYGTYITQEYMRLEPDRVRSVMLSGVLPVDVAANASVAETMEAALDVIFTGCRLDPACDEALPDPWGSLERLVADLDRSPGWYAAAAPGDLSGRTHFDGNDLLTGLQRTMYIRSIAAEIPDLLIDAEAGDRTRLVRLARIWWGQLNNPFATWIVLCNNHAPFATDTTPDVEHDFLADMNDPTFVFWSGMNDRCDAIGIEGDLATRQPVSWDAPTFIINGAADPVTPGAWARLLADRLPNATLLIHPAGGHDAEEGWCEQGLLAAFVERPEVLIDGSCVEWFATPANRSIGEYEPVSLWEQTVTLAGREVMLELPSWFADWSTDDELVYVREAVFADATTIMVVAPGGADLLRVAGITDPSAEWTEEASDATPAGWTRSVTTTFIGVVVRYVDEEGWTVGLLTDEQDITELEADVLVRVAESLEEVAP